jgi:hypothetical protein
MEVFKMTQANRRTIRGEVINRWLASGNPRWDYENTRRVCLEVELNFRLQGLIPAVRLSEEIQNRNNSYVRQWIGGCKFPWLEGYI